MILLRRLAGPIILVQLESKARLPIWKYSDHLMSRAMLMRQKWLCKPESDRLGELEPIAAVRDPPCDEQNWNGCRESPPEREDEIRQQSENREGNPEYFSLHGLYCRPEAKY